MLLKTYFYYTKDVELFHNLLILDLLEFKSKISPCSDFREIGLPDDDLMYDILIKLQKAGLIEGEDVLFHDKRIERRTMVRILHEFMKQVLKENDIDDINRASVLKDLYDCHICVNHIAQIYLKGIMNSVKPEVFGVTNRVSYFEASEAVEKVFDNTKRSSRLC